MRRRRSAFNPCIVVAAGVATLAWVLYLSASFFFTKPLSSTEARSRAADAGTHVIEGPPTLRIDPALLGGAAITQPSAAAAVALASAADSDGLVTLIADAFLVDGCVKFVSVTTCQFPFLNFSSMAAQFHAVWTGPDECVSTVEECGARLRKQQYVEQTPHPPTRVLHRDGRNWEPVTIGEFCLPDLLSSALRVDVTLSFGGGLASQRYSLDRIGALPPSPLAMGSHSSELAMVAMFRNDAWTSPAWLDVWTALGVGHFYVYFNGDMETLRAEHPAGVAALENNPRVTLQLWDFPMRTVIVDDTKTSTLPLVNVYGHIKCYLHFAKMMAFNSAFHRYRSRHEWMLYFDFDEYLVMGEADDAPHPPLEEGGQPAPLSASPLQRFVHARRQRGSGGPLAYQFVNRWTFLLPPVHSDHGPLLSDDLLRRRFLGGWFGNHEVRTKFMVRTTPRGSAAASGSSGQHPDVVLGNHFVCELQERRVYGEEGGGGTEHWGGPCLRATAPTVMAVPPGEAYVLHLINLKPHVSLLDDVDVDAMQRSAASNGSFVTSVNELLMRHREGASEGVGQGAGGW